MRYYEIIAFGFDGKSDATDNRVLWVRSPDLDFTDMLLICDAATATCEELDFQPPLADIDFTMPQDFQRLHARLTSFYHQASAR